MIERVRGVAGSPQSSPSQKGSALPFERILDQEIVFSVHARRRLEERAIPLSREVKEKLEEGLRTLEAKGGRTSLIVVDGVAFVVDVPERTVITCVENENRVFTHIDSVLFMNTAGRSAASGACRREVQKP
jgi:flagellar operon protein